MQFHVNEGIFNLPDGLQDNSMNMLLTGASGLGLNLVITRDRLEAGEVLDGFIDRQTQALTQQVSDLKFSERHAHKPTPTEETTMVELALQYKQGGQVIHQRQRCWLLADQKRVLVLTGASAAPITEAQKKSWQAICAGFQHRD